MSNSQISAAKVVPEIEVKKLSYSFPDGSSGLKDVSLNLPPGSRTLLIGGIPTNSPLMPDE
jgi:ABC-type bacteriocin/lantibiotic exporter with double-glycine peptidase domain